MLNQKVKWVFFDVGTTLVDETGAYNHRIRDVIKGTAIFQNPKNAESEPDYAVNNLLALKELL